MPLLAHQVTIRDASFTEIEPIPSGALGKLEYELTANDAASWSLTVPADSRACSLLQRDNMGIVVRVFDPTTKTADRVALSGDVLNYDIGEGADGKAVFQGFDDTLLLKQSLAYPSNADVGVNVATQLSSAYDTFTGTPEEAIIRVIANNIGMNATSRRQYPWLATPQLAGIGASKKYTMAPRFSTLLEECQKAATAGGLCFRLVQQAPGIVGLELWVPQQRVQAQFKIDNGTLQDAQLVASARKVTEVIVGGGGEAAARVFTRVTASDASRWHRRIETFKDQRQTSTVTELTQAGQGDIDENAPKLGASMVLGTAPGVVYGEDINVGDVVSARIRGVDVQDVLQSIKVTDTGVLEIVPTVGMQQQGTDTTATAIRLRVANLERTR